MRRLLGGIGQRAAAVLRQRLGLDGEQVRTREEIGVRLGVSTERVRQIEQRALGRLRAMMESE